MKRPTSAWPHVSSPRHGRPHRRPFVYLPTPHSAMTTASDHSLFEDIQALVSGTCSSPSPSCSSARPACSPAARRGWLSSGTTRATFRSGFVLPDQHPVLHFGLLALGRAFTLKTFAAVALLSLYSEVLPRWIHIESIHPVFAAIIGGLLAGAGLLMLVRHRAQADSA